MTWFQDLITTAVSNVTDREREALWERGVTTDQIETFQIGHFNNNLPDGLPEAFVRWASPKVDDVYVLPLTTTLGEVRGLQFRHVDKSIGGYQDFFLDKFQDRSLPIREACLFGLGQAIREMWRTRSVYLVEGAFDAFPIQRAMPATVATLTAKVSPQFARILRRVVDKVWVGYDNDDPGRKGASVFKRRYRDAFQVYLVEYPEVPGYKIKDPCNLWEAWGDSKLVPFIQSIINDTGTLKI